MRKRTRVWRGLSGVLAILLIISLAVANILETFSGQIDRFLGTQSMKAETTEGEETYTSFSVEDMPYDVLNEDGTGNSEKLIQTMIDFGREQASAGAVLLKNEDDVLPLSEGSAVTLLGIRSHVPILSAYMGMPIAGPVITLEDALSQNRTNFNSEERSAGGLVVGSGIEKNTTYSDFDFDGAGFQINPTMVENYSKLNETRGLNFKGPFLTGVFDPMEPSLADIAAADPDYMESFAAYQDAAIVVVGRPSREDEDYLPGNVADGSGAEEPLELTTNERDIIELAAENFDKVIVLVNTSSAMEIAELKNNDQVDAILWIGQPGSYGMLGIADILCGKVSPSGGLPDIYATKGMSHPAMMNMGDFTFANADEIGRNNSKNYIIEAEGIYVGYRYFETRYHDVVTGQGNAESTAGAYASTGNWNYSEEVAYGFGYGLSYTEFTQELVGEPVVEQSDHEFYMDFTVKVTNTGDRYSGKSIVQLYGSAPYIDGGLEKSAIQLLAYDKTDELAPGESQEVVLRVDMQNLATYDGAHDNTDGTKGCYVLDEGHYYFAVGNGAHDALNHVLAKKESVEGNVDVSKMDAGGDASLVYEVSLDYDDSTFAISKTGEAVTNQLDYADWNYFEDGEVVYLSRKDWQGTYPKTYSDLTAPASMMEYLNGQYYTVKTDDDTSSFVFEETEGEGLVYTDLKFSDYDDPRWDTLLNQMSLTDMMNVVAAGGNQFRKISSVGFLGGTLAENAGNGLSYSLNSAPGNAPWAISEDDNNINYTLSVFCCAPLVASAFDPALSYELGEIVGMQALFMECPILWGPGLNTHRHPYNGRNGEYYSEDPVLCGNITMEFSMGALAHGLIAAPKHFAFNDQETNRTGVAPFMQEAKAREIELRAYQIAFESTKYDEELGKDVGMLGLMTSYSKIGPVECTCSRELMTNILKKEWGFHGYAVTDLSDDMDLFTAVVYAGTNGYDVRSTYTPKGFSSFQSMNDGVKPSDSLYEKDEAILTSLRSAAHDVLWVFCQSNLMNSVNSSTVMVWNMTWWRGVYMGVIAVFGVLEIVAVAMYLLSVRKGGRQK